MKKEIQLANDYLKAKSELSQMGDIKTRLINILNETSIVVSIKINDIEYKSEHSDIMIATIQLRNKI